MADFTIIDNSGKVLQELDKATRAALDACGIEAASHAVRNVTERGYTHQVPWYNRTGALKKFTHQVDDSGEFVAVGTNTPYAKYWELGTGEYADGGGGRQGWWVFVPGGGGGGGGVGSSKTYSFEEAKKVMAILQSKGIDAHMTKGVKPIHMLRDAIQDHVSEYKAIIKRYLQG